MSIIIENSEHSFILNRRRVIGIPERKVEFTNGKIFLSELVPVEAQGTGALTTPISLNPGSSAINRAFKLYVEMTTATTRPLIWRITPVQAGTSPVLTFESDPQTKNRLMMISLFFDHATDEIEFELEEGDLGTAFKYKALYGDGYWKHSTNFVG